MNTTVLACRDGAPSGRLTLGDVFFLTREQTESLRGSWEEQPAVVQEADELAVWEAIDEAGEGWLLVSDVRLVSVIGNAAKPEPGETVAAQRHWWVDEISLDALVLICKQATASLANRRS